MNKFRYIHTYGPAQRRRHAHMATATVGYSADVAFVVFRNYRKLRKVYGLDAAEARHVITILLGIGASTGRQEQHDMMMSAFRKAGA